MVSPDLSVDVGSVRLKNPVLTASGLVVRAMSSPHDLVATTPKTADAVGVGPGPARPAGGERRSAP